MSTDQLPMDFAGAGRVETDPPRVKDRGPVWFGFAIEHRALLESLQDDWLRPPDSASGRVLGVRSFSVDGRQLPSEHRILVRVKLNPALLPDIPVGRHRDGDWMISPLGAADGNEDAIFWPGPLPTFSISELLVGTDEERARLSSMTRQLANVQLPVQPRILRTDEDVPGPNTDLPDKPLAGIALPAEMDMARGAMAMAVWAVPRVDPWLDLLCAALKPSPRDQLSDLAAEVDAPWWACPPWLREVTEPSAAQTQERLWNAAARVLRALHGAPATATDLVDRIAAEAGRHDSSAKTDAVDAWSREAIGLLRGHSRLNLDDWKVAPVGKAIQLVLARPEPMTFKRWKDDLPALPPAVWWSGAALCGLLHGYRRLPLTFRGDAAQQRLLATHALLLFGAMPTEAGPTSKVIRGPQWRRQAGEIVFSWSDVEFARKPENARGKWFSANLNSEPIKRAALDISAANGWHCVSIEVTAPKGEYPYSGGRVEIAESPQRLILKDEARITRLPSTARVDRVLDEREFRRSVATEGTATIPPPPEAERKVVARQQEDIPGLIYVPKFLSEAEESALVAILDKAEWSRELKRRVQHYGWRYDYKARAIDKSMRLGPLPLWAIELAERLSKTGLLPHTADQVIVNEYQGDQGISKHVDCIPCFEDGIAMISLLESWEMIFREDESPQHKVARVLERGSVTIMTRDARYRWSHEIPMRSKEPNGLVRGRRVSVTLRKVNEREVRAAKRGRKR